MENKDINKVALRMIYAQAIDEISTEIEEEAEAILDSVLGFCVKAAGYPSANTEITLPRAYFAKEEGARAVEVRHRVFKKLKSRDLTVSVDELNGDVTISW